MKSSLMIRTSFSCRKKSVCLLLDEGKTCRNCALFVLSCPVQKHSVLAACVFWRCHDVESVCWKYARCGGDICFVFLPLCDSAFVVVWMWRRWHKFWKTVAMKPLKRRCDSLQLELPSAWFSRQTIWLFEALMSLDTAVVLRWALRPVTRRHRDQSQAESQGCLRN